MRPYPVFDRPIEPVASKTGSGTRI